MPNGKDSGLASLLEAQEDLQLLKLLNSNQKNWQFWSPKRACLLERRGVHPPVTPHAKPLGTPLSTERISQAVLPPMPAAAAGRNPPVQLDREEVPFLWRRRFWEAHYTFHGVRGF